MNRMCVCVFCVFFVNFALLLLRFALTFPFQRNEFDMQNKNAKVRMKEPERERNETKKKQIIMRMEWMCANEALSTQWALITFSHLHNGLAFEWKPPNGIELKLF